MIDQDEITSRFEGGEVFVAISYSGSRRRDEAAPRADVMNDRALADKLLQDHFTATAALIALMLKDLPEFVRSRVFDAVRNGTGKVELRTRVESNETELVLVPTDGSEPLWLARASE